MNDQPQECTSIYLNDPRLLPFLKRLQIDPNDYEANKILALGLSENQAMIPMAEDLFIKALSHNRTDDPEYGKMLSLMAWIFETKGDIDNAIKVLMSLVNVYPDDLGKVANLADLYFQNGQIDVASDLYKRLVSLHLTSADSSPRHVGEPVTQLLDPLKPMRSRFGELAENLCLYAKARILGLTPQVRALLLLAEDEVVSDCLFECLQSSLSDHITFVSARQECDAMKLEYSSNEIHLNYYIAEDGRGLPREPMHTLVQRQWEESGRGPLVSLPDKYDDMGRDLLRSHGMPDDAWFVCFHARDMGFHNEAIASSQQNIYRNANIKDYIPAMEAVRNNGGWVVRIGDHTMPPLPEMEGVIDYAVCDWRQDWIDIFLIARQRFLVGTASGPPSVALAFGVPVVSTNWFPAGLWPHSTRDIVIHKLYRHRDDGGYLKVDEMVRPPTGSMHSKQFFDSRGIEVEDNSPDDIRDAVTEMIERCEGTAKYTPEDERLQQRFKTLADGMDVGVNPRAGREFLRRHRFLLG